MKKKINDLLLKMQNNENCIGDTANELLALLDIRKCNSKKDPNIDNGYLLLTNRKGLHTIYCDGKLLLEDGTDEDLNKLNLK